MDSPARLERLRQLRSLVDVALDRTFPVRAGDDRISAAMRYAVVSPGKRIRPLLTLLTAGQLGVPVARAMAPACAVELVHAASLVLDDLPCMDDAELRRGRPTVHRQFGQDIAVLAGVGLLNEAYNLILRADGISAETRCDMAALLSQTVGVAGLIGGQDKDLVGCERRSFAELSQLHHEKTGVLFVAAVELGAFAAGADADARETLRQFGCELGLAFQAADDVQDQAELETIRASSNLLSVLGAQGARIEVNQRMERARQVLRRGTPQLAAMDAYLDLLVSPMAA